MQDTLTQADLDLLTQWGACEESVEYRKVGQPLSEIPKYYLDWAIRKAAKNGYLEIVNRLLKAQVNQWAIDAALYWAAEYGNLKIVKRLLKTGVNQKTIDAVLYWAKSYKHTDVVDLLEKKSTSTPL